MAIDFDVACCPECGGSTLIGMPAGTTCTGCGLVVDEERTMVNQPVWSKSGVVSCTAVLRPGAAADWRRLGLASPAMGRAARRQRTYDDRQKTRAWHVAMRVGSALDLPGLRDLVEQAMALHAKMRRGLARTRLAPPGLLAPVALLIAARARGVAVETDDVIAMAGVDPVLFKRALLRGTGVLRRVAPELLARPDPAREIANVATRVLRALGIPSIDVSEVARVAGTVRRLAGSAKVETSGAITAWILCILGGEVKPPVSSTSAHAGLEGSSLHNGIRRVLARVGIDTRAPPLDRAAAVIRVFGMPGPAEPAIEPEDEVPAEPIAEPVPGPAVEPVFERAIEPPVEEIGESRMLAREGTIAPAPDAADGMPRDPATPAAVGAIARHRLPTWIRPRRHRPARDPTSDRRACVTGTVPARAASPWPPPAPPDPAVPPPWRRRDPSRPAPIPGPPARAAPGTRRWQMQGRQGISSTEA